MKKTLILIACILTGIATYAQESYPVFFMQNALTGLVYNPGFAGTAGSPRISAAIASENKAMNYMGSYDQYSDKLRSGIGVSAQYNRIHTLEKIDVQLLSVGISIAPKITLNDKLTLSPSVGLYYQGTTRNDTTTVQQSETFHIPKGTPPDSIIIVDSVVTYDVHKLKKQTLSYADIRLGFMMNIKKTYAGIAIGDFMHTNFFMLPGYKSSLSVTLQAGTAIRFKQITFQPSGFLQIKHVTHTTETETSTKWMISNAQLQLNVRYKWFVAGGAMNTFYYVGTVGFQNKQLKLLLSSGYGHQSQTQDSVLMDVSCSYTFKK